MAGTDEAVEETTHYVERRREVHRVPAGETHGAWSWFRTDGSLMRTGLFDRGRQVGTWRTYDRSGAIVKETELGD